MQTGSFKMFGCPVCGFRVNLDERACPRCGNGFGDKTRLECPFCGDLVDPNMTKCPSCQVDYTDFRQRTEARGGDDSIDELLNEIIKIESQQVKSEDKKQLSCPECAWLLNGSERKCPKCGTDLRDDLSFQCPICGSTVASDAPSCPECGASFEEEAHEAGKDLEEVRPEPEAEPQREVPPETPAPEPEPRPAPEPLPEQPPEPSPARPPVVFVKPARKRPMMIAQQEEPEQLPKREEPEPTPPPETEITEERIDVTQEANSAPEPVKEPAAERPSSAKKKTRKLKAKPHSRP